LPRECGAAKGFGLSALRFVLNPLAVYSKTTLLYKIPRIIIGENVTFKGPEEYVRSQGVKVEVLQDPACIQLMREFIAARPELWNEDIGV